MPVPTEAELARAEGRSFETAEEMLKRARAESDGSAQRRASRTKSRIGNSSGGA